MSRRRYVTAVAVALIASIVASLPSRPASASISDVFATLRVSIAIISNTADSDVGTGFCVHSDANASYFLTNQHVVGNRDRVTVYRQYPTYKKLTGTVVAHGVIDPGPDLALVRVDQGLIPPLRLDAIEPRTGDPIANAGYPSAQYDLAEITGSIVPSLHTGIVSAVEANGALVEFDAQTLPGNSGGPLFDPATGTVVGVVQAKLKNANEVNLAIGIRSVVLPFLQAHRISYTPRAGQAPVVATIPPPPQRTPAPAPRPTDRPSTNRPRTPPSDDTPPSNDGGGDSHTPHGLSDDPAPEGGSQDRGLPRSSVVVVLYDTSLATGKVARLALTNAATDFAQKFGHLYNVHMLLVDEHIEKSNQIRGILQDRGASIGVDYDVAFHRDEDRGRNGTWMFLLKATMYDRTGTLLTRAGPKTSNASAGGDPEETIEGALDDLNDRALKDIDAAK